ncbi:hypothetical protein DL95DRAFT_412334 [Leptodontidium sp. 2 PMI_412]|nr:hypothetical protein DL95DRAFT_412334 [Leptodontidium sp. 2 PMI_412]
MDSPWNHAGLEGFIPPLAFFSLPSNNRFTQPEPQSHVHTRPSLAGRQMEVRKYTTNDWNTHRAEITRLYEDETLPTLMKFMRQNHGLDATPKQYKDRFTKWGVQKSIRPKEMKAMLRKEQKREPKKSAFRLRGIDVTAKVTRYKYEHPGSPSGVNKDWDMDKSIDSAPTPGAISCYTPVPGPLTPHAAPSPQASSVAHASENPQSPISYQSPYGGSYQFGDPAFTLPSSHSVVQMTGSTYRQASSPMSIATSPTLSAPIELSEIVFTGQSPAPFSVPSTPRLQDRDVMQDRGMGVMYDNGDHFAKQQMRSFDEHIAPPLYATSSPFSQLFGTDPSRDYHTGEDDVFGIASGITAGLTAMPLSEVYAAMILSVNDALIIDQYIAFPASLGTLGKRHKLAETLCRQGSITMLHYITNERALAMKRPQKGSEESAKPIDQAHRQVLGTRSPYFDDALQSGFKEGITHEISFEKDSPHALWRALQESSAIGHGRLYMTRSRSLFATPAEKARKILDKAISVLKRRATYFEGEKLIKESELGRMRKTPMSSIPAAMSTTLKQDWVSIVYKSGIEMHERTCAYLSSASLCICTREERMLRNFFRRESQLEKEMYVTTLAFEDKNFMDLRKRALGRNGQCSCPPIGVAIVGGPTTPGLPAFFAKECSTSEAGSMDKTTRERFL